MNKKISLLISLLLILLFLSPLTLAAEPEQKSYFELDLRTQSWLGIEGSNEGLTCVTAAGLGTDVCKAMRGDLPAEEGGASLVGIGSKAVKDAVLVGSLTGASAAAQATTQAMTKSIAAMGRPQVIKELAKLEKAGKVLIEVTEKAGRHQVKIFASTKRGAMLGEKLLEKGTYVLKGYEKVGKFGGMAEFLSAQGGITGSRLLKLPPTEAAVVNNGAYVKKYANQYKAWKKGFDRMAVLGEATEKARKGSTAAVREANRIKATLARTKDAKKIARLNKELKAAEKSAKKATKLLDKLAKRQAALAAKNTAARTVLAEAKAVMTGAPGKKAKWLGKTFTGTAKLAKKAFAPFARGIKFMAKPLTWSGKTVAAAAGRIGAIKLGQKLTVKSVVGKVAVPLLVFGALYDVQRLVVGYIAKSYYEMQPPYPTLVLGTGGEQPGFLPCEENEEEICIAIPVTYTPNPNSRHNLYLMSTVREHMEENRSWLDSAASWIGLGVADAVEYVSEMGRKSDKELTVECRMELIKVSDTPKVSLGSAPSPEMLERLKAGPIAEWSSLRGEIPCKPGYNPSNAALLMTEAVGPGFVLGPGVYFVNFYVVYDPMLVVATSDLILENLKRGDGFPYNWSLSWKPEIPPFIEANLEAMDLPAERKEALKKVQEDLRNPWLRKVLVYGYPTSVRFDIDKPLEEIKEQVEEQSLIQAIDSKEIKETFEKEGQLIEGGVSGAEAPTPTHFLVVAEASDALKTFLSEKNVLLEDYVKNMQVLEGMQVVACGSCGADELAAERIVKIGDYIVISNLERDKYYTLKTKVGAVEFGEGYLDTSEAVDIRTLIPIGLKPTVLSILREKS